MIKETLEAFSVLLGILGVLFGGIMAIIKGIEKRAKKKEATEQWVKRIEEKLLHLEANTGRLTEELEDVRKDFAQFVQQLLFKK